MANEIISYLEMCARERTSLQQGMNFGIGSTHSVILMSLRPNAPYEDRVEADGSILVYEGRLEAVEGEEDLNIPAPVDPVRRRRIPAHVKYEVWKRDGGKCVECGATDELHFDHDLPYSLGGTSLTAANAQLLCARHNLSNGARLQ